MISSHNTFCTQSSVRAHAPVPNRNEDLYSRNSPKTTLIPPAAAAATVNRANGVDVQNAIFPAIINPRRRPTTDAGAHLNQIITLRARPCISYSFSFVCLWVNLPRAQWKRRCGAGWWDFMTTLLARRPLLNNMLDWVRTCAGDGTALFSVFVSHAMCVCVCVAK